MDTCHLGREHRLERSFGLIPLMIETKKFSIVPTNYATTKRQIRELLDQALGENWICRPEGFPEKLESNSDIRMIQHNEVGFFASDTVFGRGAGIPRSSQLLFVKHRTLGLSRLILCFARFRRILCFARFRRIVFAFSQACSSGRLRETACGQFHLSGRPSSPRVFPQKILYMGLFYTFLLLLPRGRLAGSNPGLIVIFRSFRRSNATRVDPHVRLAHFVLPALRGAQRDLAGLKTVVYRH